MNLLENIITSIDLDGLKDRNGEYLKDVDIENIFSIFNELVKTDFVDELFFNKKIIPYIFKILEKNVYFGDNSIRNTNDFRGNSAFVRGRDYEVIFIRVNRRVSIFNNS